MWLNQPSPTTFQAGALSAGAVTPATGVPLSGMATFLGLTSGSYVDTAGAPYFTSANMRADANFGNRSVAFSTTGTTIGNISTGALPSAAPALNISGILSYAQGTNQFTGPVSTAGPPTLSGSATGRFYGPAAEEIGGVYSLTGNGAEQDDRGFRRKALMPPAVSE